MAHECAESGVAVWAWCLMPNHVHRVAVPKTAEGLAAAIGRAHWRYTRAVNFRENWRGYLWQGRFSSCPMDRPHAIAAARRKSDSDISLAGAWWSKRSCRRNRLCSCLRPGHRDSHP